MATALDVIANAGAPTIIGRVGENEFRRIKFPIANWLALYSGASFTLVHRRSHDSGGYPVANTTTDANYLYWTVASGDVAYEGIGAAELQITYGDTIAKSVIYPTEVLPSVVDSETAPTEWEDYIQRTYEAAREVDTVNDYMNAAYQKESVGPASIVTLEDAAELPLVKVETSFAPVQDLHGYDYPWPAGTTKNLFDESTIINGYYATNDPTSITASNAYRTARLTLPAGTYTFSTDLTNPRILRTWYDNENHNLSVDSGTTTFTTTTEGTVAVCWRNTSTSAITQTLHTMIEAGSTATTYIPYSNICPITGWTGVKFWCDPTYGGTIYWNQLVQNGNFASADNWSGVNGTLAVSNNKAVLTYNSGTKPRIVQQLTASTVPNHIYLMSGWVTAATAFTLRIGMSSTNNGGTTSTIISAAANTKTHIWAIKSSSSALSYMFAGIINASTDTAAESGTLTFEDFYMVDLTAMFGSAIANYISALESSTVGAGMAWFSNLFPSAYYPYNAGTEACVSAVNGDPYRYVSVDWTAQAGTVYRGTLDVTSGVLTATWTKQALGRTGWTIATNGSSRRYLRNFSGMGIPAPDTSNLDALCTHFERVTEAEKSTAQFGTFRISDSGYMVVYDNNNKLADNNAFMAWLDAQNTAGTPVEICYQLETPITYQLTPQQITALLGHQYVWSSTNGETSVEYRKDFITLVEDASSSDAVNVSGSVPVVRAQPYTCYICGEVMTLDFTPSPTGMCEIIFTSGSTATLLNLPDTVLVPEWFDPMSLEPNTIYDISVMNGIYGAVMTWPVS